MLYPDRRRCRFALTASPSSRLDRSSPHFAKYGPGSLADSQDHRNTGRPSFLFSCFLRVWVPVAFTAPQGRRILGSHVPAMVDTLELCSGSHELPNHGGNYASPFYVSFRFCFFFVQHLALPFYAYDASVGPLYAFFWHANSVAPCR